MQANNIANKSIIEICALDQDVGMNILIDEYGERLYWHIRRLVVSHHDTDDVMQETLIRIFRSIKSLTDPQKLTSWIYRIATNESIRFLGNRKRTVELDTDNADMTADGYVDFGDAEALMLQKAILSLPPKQQAIFNLRYYDELSYQEIGFIAGVSESSAKANYHIAKDKITKFLTDNII